jgi:hypothetical protein
MSTKPIDKLRRYYLYTVFLEFHLNFLLFQVV